MTEWLNEPITLANVLSFLAGWGFVWAWDRVAAWRRSRPEVRLSRLCAATTLRCTHGCVAGCLLVDKYGAKNALEEDEN